MRAKFLRQFGGASDFICKRRPSDINALGLVSSDLPLDDSPKFTNKINSLKNQALKYVKEFYKTCSRYALFGRSSRAVNRPKPVRACTCHPDDNPPVPCPQRFAFSDCVAAARSAQP